MLDECCSFQIPYYLDEDSNWQLNIEHLGQAVQSAKLKCEPRVLVVINPGNPTGKTDHIVTNQYRPISKERLISLVQQNYHTIHKQFKYQLNFCLRIKLCRTTTLNLQFCNCFSSQLASQLFKIQLHTQLLSYLIILCNQFMLSLIGTAQKILPYSNYAIYMQDRCCPGLTWRI